MTISTLTDNLADSAQTPLMKQYWELKEKAPNALLLFRMGDFYELFGDDAVEASQILEITLTSRDRNKPNPTPMAGVPHHSVQGYIQKLLKAGKKIAIGEQVEDPETVKGTGRIVRREVVRILTPGIQFDAEGSESNYLATVLKTPSQAWVLVCLDASTGEVLVSDPLDAASLASEFRRLPIRHFLHFEGDVSLSALSLLEGVLVEVLPRNYLSTERAAALLKHHYEVENLKTFVSTESGVLALGVLVTYVLRTQQQDRLAHLRMPAPLHQPQSLVLGPNSVQHLDLMELYQMINQTRSTLGARQLKRWMLAPLLNPSEISGRQEAILELTGQVREPSGNSISPKTLERISSVLGDVYDLERIAGRVSTRLAHPKDILALGQSLLSLKALKGLLGRPSSRALGLLWGRISDLWDTLGPVAERIVQEQREDAPISSKDGGIFQRGTSPELDRLLELSTNGEKWLIELETREREATGIPSLKVKYNRVFGYYIEVTQTHLKSVPAHYQRKQTMVGAERFFTDELKKFEEEILTASSKQKFLELELFQQRLDEVHAQTSAIMEAARALGEIDALVSLTKLLSQANWNFPEVNHSLEMEIVSGRHPMVDQAKRGQFVPNGLSLSPQTRLSLMITGPNMGGKSTVMRQTALIVILGQMGAPVPAKKARWGSVSSLYTRIGAQDAISKGQSTFMVEMSELAYLLHHSDERSLIILDEIGRGTSTYDGMSVAWATLEWLCSRVQARTLFATHYHELVRLESVLPLLANAHMAVDSPAEGSVEKLRFLYELREGPANESFGIHVAQLAGLPKEVTDRAWKVLEELEAGGKGEPHLSPALGHPLDPLLSKVDQLGASLNQMSLFDHRYEGGVKGASGLSKPVEAKLESHPILKELESIEVNEMTPLQALNFVVDLKNRWSKSGLCAAQK